MAIPCTPTGDKQVQLRRGTTAENNAFTGADGELSFDTDQNRLRVHDGVTPGGFPIAFLSEIVAGSSPPFIDTTNIVMGSADPTKLLRFEVDGFTAATTRTLTPQDASYTIAGLETANLFTANQNINNNIALNTDGTANFDGHSVFMTSVDFAGGAASVDPVGNFVAPNVEAELQLTVNTAVGEEGNVEFRIFNTDFSTTTFEIFGNGRIGFPDGIRQTFNPDATVAGLNAGALAGDPSTPINGDIWYDSTANELTARINGVNVALGAGAGGTPGGADTQVQFNDAGAFGGDAGLTYNKTTDLLTSLKTAIGVTPTDVHQLINTTAAAVGAQQVSPGLRWTGQAWNTTASASQAVDFRAHVLPVQGSTIGGNLLITASLNGAAFSTIFTLTDQGTLTLIGNLVVGATNAVRFGTTQSRIRSPSDGQITLFNAAESGFTRLNFGGTTSSFPSIRRTAATLDFRLADDSAYAAFTSGSHTFAVAALLSITSGTNQRAGNATLVAGTVTVSNTTVTANTIVMITRKTSGGTLGTAITYTVSAGTSFTINSDSALDTSVFSYFLIEVP